MPVAPLNTSELLNRVDPDDLPFRNTTELVGLDTVLGQDRAVEALQFGIGIRRDGYNMFVLGAPGTGRHSLVRRFLEQRAAQDPAPPDWVYVYNFQTPHQPSAIELPSGRANGLRHDMARLVEDLRAAVPALFESEDYRSRRQAIDEEIKERQEAAFHEVQEEAQRRGLALVRTPMGLALAPVKGNEVMPPEEFRALPPAQRQRLEQDIEELQVRLQETVQHLPEWERERRERVRELNRSMTQLAVSNLMAALREAYSDLASVVAYLEAVEKDVIEHVDAFLPQEGQPPPEAAALMGRGAHGAVPVPLRRYQVNVMVGGDGGDGAPVITEDLPTQPNLVGRVEHMQELGALVTDFTLIKPGALHRANGGYLVLDALKLLVQPLAWEALKRAIRGRRITIESVAQMLSMISTVSLEPGPIPLNLKVVLVGDRELYYLLCRLDPDFGELFKVEVDLAEDIDRDGETTLAYSRLIANLVQRDGLKPFNRQGVARVIEQCSRRAGDRGKISIRVGPLADLLREADFFAGEAGRRTVGAGEVQQAIDAQIRRADRIRERAHEMILHDVVLIDTDGTRVGQINGLAVLDLGTFSFGRPSRITARVRIGTGEVVDIERRVELGGPIHSKGVLILSAFLGARFAAEHPLSLSASLVFEQSYGGVEGDSASSAELYALLSALAELPIDQGFAVTGSVNQHGRVQAIGGVNEKIEGFFDICRARGLTGRQGVLIPRSNVRHLMLRQDVIEAVRGGQFAVYAVGTIDEGIEILTGVPAGEADAAGVFPEGTVNRRVQDRLVRFAELRRKYGVTGRERAGDGAEDKERRE